MRGVTPSTATADTTRTLVGARRGSSHRASAHAVAAPPLANSHHTYAFAIAARVDRSALVGVRRTPEGPKLG